MKWAPSDARTACVMSIQTFGEQVDFNPHIHVIAADCLAHANRTAILRALIFEYYAPKKADN